MEGTGLDNEFVSTRYGVLRVAHFVSIPEGELLNYISESIVIGRPVTIRLPLKGGHCERAQPILCSTWALEALLPGATCCNRCWLETMENMCAPGTPVVRQIRQRAALT